MKIIKNKVFLCAIIGFFFIFSFQICAATNQYTQDYSELAVNRLATIYTGNVTDFNQDDSENGSLTDSITEYAVPNSDTSNINPPLYQQTSTYTNNDYYYCEFTISSLAIPPPS